MKPSIICLISLKSLSSFKIVVVSVKTPQVYRLLTKKNKVNGWVVFGIWVTINTFTYFPSTVLAFNYFYFAFNLLSNYLLFTIQLSKNTKADAMVKDLYVENAQLLKALEMTEQRQKTAERKNYLLEEKIANLNRIVKNLASPSFNSASEIRS